MWNCGNIPPVGRRQGGLSTLECYPDHLQSTESHGRKAVHMQCRRGQQLFGLWDTEQGSKLSSLLACASLSPLNDHFKDDWWNHGVVSGGCHMAENTCHKSMGTSASLEVSPDKADGIF